MRAGTPALPEYLTPHMGGAGLVGWGRENIEHRTLNVEDRRKRKSGATDADLDLGDHPGRKRARALGGEGAEEEHEHA